MIKGFNIKRFPMFVSLFLASVSCGQKKDVAIKVEKEPDSSVSDHIPNTVLFNRVPDTCLKPWLRPDKCSFYRECLEASITCENTPFPYAMSYGDKYCNKFQGITLTTRGEGWKRGATLCLQEANRLTGSSGQTHDGQGNVHGTCSEARQLNFEAHVSCYLGGPARFSRRTSTTICALDYRDWIKIFSIVDARDYATKESLVQMKGVISRCIPELKNKLMGISPPGPNWPTSNLTTPAEDSETVGLLEEKIKEYDARISSDPVAYPIFQ